MPFTRTRLLLSAALSLAMTSSAIGSSPRGVAGNGGSPSFGDDYELHFMTMDACPGPIATGWSTNFTSGVRLAQQFIPSITDTPAGVIVGVSDDGFSTLNLAAAIYTDAGGGVPGTLLTSTLPTPVSSPPVYPAAVAVRMRFMASPPLNAGTSYVLVIDAPLNGCLVVGNGTNACSGVALQSLDGGLTWTTLGVDLCHKLVGF